MCPDVLQVWGDVGTAAIIFLTPQHPHLTPRATPMQQNRLHPPRVWLADVSFLPLHQRRCGENFSHLSTAACQYKISCILPRILAQYSNDVPAWDTVRNSCIRSPIKKLIGPSVISQTCHIVEPVLQVTTYMCVCASYSIPSKRENYSIGAQSIPWVSLLY